MKDLLEDVRVMLLQGYSAEYIASCHGLPVEQIGAATIMLMDDPDFQFEFRSANHFRQVGARTKADEQILAEANTLDHSYMSAEIHDLRGDVAYLTRTLHDLYHQVRADIPEENMSQSLLQTMYKAAEAIGLGEAG